MKTSICMKAIRTMLYSCALFIGLFFACATYAADAWITNVASYNGITNVQQSDSFYVEARVYYNTNGAPTTGVVYTDFYLSSNTVIDASDYKVCTDGNQKPFPEYNDFWIRSVKLTNVPTGIYYLIAKTDASNLWSEVNENNNTNRWSSQITVTALKPDLVITNITIDTTSPIRVTNFNMTAYGKNNGPGNASQEKIYAYLSADSTISVSDTLIGNNTGQSLSNGQSRALTIPCYLPSNTVDGTYYLGAIIDPDNTIQETNETNNSRSYGSIQIIKPAPEMDVKGNGTSIADGDTTPTTSDFTDFGTTPYGVDVERLFYIYNTGNASLTLGTVEVPSGFAITVGPGSSVAAGGSAWFRVRLNSTTAGTFTGDISIPNNDANENPYNFRVTGTVSGPPEIDVKGNGQSITDGDSTPSATDWTDFGNTQVGTPVEKTYYIHNTGTGPLAIGETTVPFGFSLTEAPSASISVGGSNRFRVRLDATAVDTYAGDVRIENNDANENPYNFRISGTVAAASLPEMDVKGNGISIADGDTTPTTADFTDFGTTSYGVDVERLFYIYNTGSNSLSLGTVEVPSGFAITVGPGSLVAAGGSAWFRVRLNSTEAGTFTGDISIPNNDANENPYNFRVTGSVSGPPEIDVKGNSQSISDGDTTPSVTDWTDFGNTQVGTPVEKTYYVYNTGTGPLAIGETTVPFGFSLTEAPSSSISVGGSNRFRVRLDATAADTYAGNVRIENNDANENPYSFRISGVVQDSPPTEIWSSWVNLQNVPEAGGSNVNIMIKHDGNWRQIVDYGITDLNSGHGRAFGYTVAGANFLSTDKGHLQYKLISRVASTLDAELNRTSGSMLPFLATDSEYFAFDIGPTPYSKIVEWQETSGGTTARGRVFRWRTIADMLTGQPGLPHFGFVWPGEYHNASTRRSFYRDAIRTVIYQVDRSQNKPDLWVYQFTEGAAIVKDSLFYLITKETIDAAQKVKLQDALDALNRLEELTVSISPAIPATDYVPIMEKLWAAQDTLNSGPVNQKLVNYLGADSAKALNWLNGLNKALKIIDAVLKGLSIGDNISRAYYFNTIYAQLGGAPQVEERLAALQACQTEAALFDPALSDAISDEVTMFNQMQNTNNIFNIVSNLPPEAKQHLYNVAKTGVQMGADAAFGAGVTAAFGTLTSVPALALVAVDAFLFGELVGAVFDVSEDSQRLMSGNAYLSLDLFLKERIEALLPTSVAGYTNLSANSLTRLGAMSSIGTYSARQAISKYKAAIEDAGLVGNFIQWLARGFNDGSAYLKALDEQMAFYLDMFNIDRRLALWDNAKTLINIGDISYYRWTIPEWVYSGTFIYSPPISTTSTNATIITISSPSQGGTTSGGGTVSNGSSVTVTAIPSAGYSFVNWIEGGSNISTSLNYTFTANGNRSLVARFSAIPYAINTSSSPSGGGTTSGGGTNIYGDAVTLTATPNSCYNFTNWTENGTVVSTNRHYTFTTTTNRNLVANYSIIKYSINTSSAPPEGGSTSGGGSKTCGASVTVTATSSGNFMFINWTESGTVVSTTSNYSFIVATNRTLIANFSSNAILSGAVRVTINPVEAITAGASWRIDANSWQNSGTVVSGISTGQHIVSFSDVSGWVKPANTAIVVVAYQTNIVAATYTAVTNIGISSASLYYSCDYTNGVTVFDGRGDNNGTIDDATKLYFIFSPELGRYCLRKEDSNTAGITPLRRPVSNATFSISCWAKPTGSGPLFMMNQGPYSAEKTYDMSYERIHYQYSNGSTYPQRSGAFTSNGWWHHFVWVNQDNGNGTANLRLYVDGVKCSDTQLTSSEYSSTVGANQKFLVQRPYSALYYQYIGEVCNIAVFDAIALSDADVFNLYVQNKPINRPQVQCDGIFGIVSNRFGFNFNWVSGKVVVVDACTNLANSNWIPLQTNTLTGSSFYFSDSRWTNFIGRFYRLRSQ